MSYLFLACFCRRSGQKARRPSRILLSPAAVEHPRFQKETVPQKACFPEAVFDVADGSSMELRFQDLRDAGEKGVHVGQEDGARTYRPLLKGCCDPSISERTCVRQAGENWKI
ncbi:MAG: hypothetical protein QHH10_09830 [Peptococcaceae bacterium]|jgi:hypothetical protein|nr:hypothetical protein [Peptococcaceae bacterium]